MAKRASVASLFFVYAVPVVLNPEVVPVVRAAMSSRELVLVLLQQPLGQPRESLCLLDHATFGVGD